MTQRRIICPTDIFLAGDMAASETPAKNRRCGKDNLQESVRESDTLGGELSSSLPRVRSQFRNIPPFQIPSEPEKCRFYNICFSRPKAAPWMLRAQDVGQR